jgi:hypothetical protein
MRVQKIVMLIVPLAATLSGSPARAERMAGPCRQDIQKLCPDIKPGGGAFRDCLKQHEAELSPDCKAHVTQMKAKVEAWRQACQTDVQQFCAKVEPGGGNVLKCLHQHRDQLSQSCKDQMAQAHHRHRHHAAAAPSASQPSPQ